MTDPMPRLTAALADRYRVERELGEGGMATVYRAEDLKHSRRVAIKVLKPELAAVVGAERFLGEIETTANLQHPHILPLFDSGEADGFLFYVMPYVEGESLRERLDREKQLPVDEGVSIAGKVASALQAAHERGVIHRDIKPANILMDAHGEPLVADFGIALAVSAAGGGRLTETGLSLGTPYYMSPEQASGEATVDPRSDVYALGCVLYEMLVGDPPFRASTPQAVLARVLTSTPDRVMEHRTSVPPHVDAVIARSMERIPADRFGSVAEFRRALDDEGFRHGRSVSVEAEPRRTPAMRRAIAGLAALAVLLAAVAWAGWTRSGDGIAPYRSFTLATPLDGLNGEIALSPDGRLLATVDSSRNLQVSTLDGSEPPLLPEVTRVRNPKFSPDGSRLGFIMSVVSLTGWPVLAWIPTDGAGSATVAGELRGGWHWGLDGELWMETADGIRVLDSEGEPGELLPQPEGRWGLLLDQLPDGRFLAGLSEPRDGRRLAVWDPRTGELQIPESQQELRRAGAARFSNGFLFWNDRDGVLSATPFDIDGAGVTGPRIVLQDSVSGGRDRFAILDDGTLVAVTGRTESAVRNIGWVDLDGNVEILHEPWADELEGIHRIALSPDGRRAAASVHPRPGMAQEGLDQIWVLDLEERTGNPIVFDGSVEVAWLGNGRVAYLGRRDGRNATIVATPADGGGAKEMLVEASPGQYIHNFTVLPDSSGVLYDLHVEDQDDIMHASFEDGAAPRPWLATALGEAGPVVSPDGRWVAYRSTDTGLNEVYIRSFTGAGPSTRISTGGVDSYIWHPDGRTLYYESSGQLRSARLAFDGNRVRVVESEEIFSSEPFAVGYASMDPATERFLFVVGSPEPPEYRIRLHLNVLEEIERRIEAGR